MLNAPPPKPLKMLAWFGGKMPGSALNTWITERLPTDAQYYLEPFAGMAGILLARQPAPTEIINDLDDKVYSFWLTLRTRPDDLERLLADTPYSRSVFYDARRVLAEPNHDHFQTAWALIVVASQGFQGITGEATGWKGVAAENRDRARTWRKICARLTTDAVRQRLSAVALENGDGVRLISKWVSNPKALIYCDPPYHNASTSYGASIDTDRLLGILASDGVAARVAISGYPGSPFASLGWEQSSTQIFSHAKKASVTECLWTNYDPPVGVGQPAGAPVFQQTQIWDNHF